MDNQPEKQAITPESLSLEEKLKELISYQIDVNETEKNIYKLTSKENLDIKLQIEKGKNLMDMRRMACAYIEEGRIHIGSCIVYANPLGLFARPMIKKLKLLLIPLVLAVIYVLFELSLEQGWIVF